MWIKVATDKSAIKNSSYGIPYISGPKMEKYYFDESVADKLEDDGFLSEMWTEYDALFDWYDCDYFSAKKCQKLQPWLRQRLSKDLKPEVREVYEVILKYTEIAIEADTGIYFDF